MENQKSAIGLDANVAAALGYPIGIIALILIFMEKENKFVRFHAIQSVLWAVLMTILAIVIMIVGTIIVIGGGAATASSGSTAASGFLVIVGLLLTVLWIAWFIALLGGIIYAAVKAYGGNMTKLPIVGNFAQKWSS